MNYFTSRTQYDQCYKELGAFSRDRSACPFFSLITAFNFLSKKEASKESYEKALDLAITNYILNDIKGHMSFDQLLTFSNINQSKIEATSVELIQQNILGFDSMFKPDDYKKPYCVIFLKNSKFFTVLIDAKNLFHIRDCHELNQYTFDTKAALIEHINQVYQFNQEINLDGYVIAEFSNVEFLIIDEQFKINLETDIVSPAQEKKEENYEEYAFYDDDYDNYQKDEDEQYEYFDGDDGINQEFEDEEDGEFM